MSISFFSIFNRVILASLFVLLTSTSWAATTIDVTTTNDELNADSNISLREAFDQANNGSDTEYTINLTGGQTYALTLGHLEINRPGVSLTINGSGNGVGLAIVDASANPAADAGLFLFNNQTILNPPPIDTTLNNLEIRGSGTNDHNTLFSAVGAVVRVGIGDHLTINRCYIHDNFGEYGAINPVSVDFVTINDSTISNNTAHNLGGAYNGQNAHLDINNSTITGNSANIGGGIRPSPITRIRNTTISGNTATNGGGIYLFPNTQLDMQNSILSGNTATTAGANCFNAYPAYPGTLLSGHDVLGTLPADCAFTGSGDQTGVDNPMLGPLADNGGLTPTRALLAGSAAVDNGDPSGCTDVDGNPLANDQRGPGFPRTQDGDNNGTATCDSGAYELTNTFSEIEDVIDGIKDSIASLPSSSFSNPNHKNTLQNKLNGIFNQLSQIEDATDPDVRASLINDLENKLINDMLTKGDGCGTVADKNDWITNCAAQIEYRDQIQDILDLLNTL